MLNFQLQDHTFAYHTHGVQWNQIKKMATTTETAGTTGTATIREVNGNDRIEKGTPLTHTTTNISLSPELFEKVVHFFLMAMGAC